MGERTFINTTCQPLVWAAIPWPWVCWSSFPWQWSGFLDQLWPLRIFAFSYLNSTSDRSIINKEVPLAGKMHLRVCLCMCVCTWAHAISLAKMFHFIAGSDNSGRSWDSLLRQAWVSYHQDWIIFSAENCLSGDNSCRTRVKCLPVSSGGESTVSRDSGLISLTSAPPKPTSLWAEPWDG